jgi:hypothetical protein
MLSPAHAICRKYLFCGFGLVALSTTTASGSLARDGGDGDCISNRGGNNHIGE